MSGPREEENDDQEGEEEKNTKNINKRERKPVH